MPKFYNTSRGPVSFVTASGKVASVGPKKWLDVSEAETSSDSLVQLVQRGILVLGASEPALAAPIPAAPAPISVKPPPPPEKPKVEPVAEKPAIAKPDKEDSSKKVDPPKADTVKAEPPVLTKTEPKKEDIAKVEAPKSDAPVVSTKPEDPLKTVDSGDKSSKV